jgi:hypothetical protein
MKKKRNKKNFLKEILKGDFLVKEDAYKSWKFLLFLAFLALISVTSSHIMDNKIRNLANLNDKLLEFKSQLIEIQSQLIEIQLRSSIEEKAKLQKLERLHEPPYEIIVE